MNFIVLAVPAFLLLIAAEFVIDRIKGTGVYRLNDAVNSLSCGMVSRLTGLLYKLIPFTLYGLVWQSAALFQFDRSQFWVWIFAFIIYDFFYYWSHRFGHEVNIFWAAHVVHHQSEDYNLTTALRQTSSRELFGWVFYLPLAIIGLDPVLFIGTAALNQLYQFWVHTQLIKRLPAWYEYVFVTPSNHRVHHAQNSVYIDRNYGGFLIIWDRMFGTFQDELPEEPCIFGVRKALRSWNPLWANLDWYAVMWRDAVLTRRWQDKLLIWFKPTGWRPDDVAKSHPVKPAVLDEFKKYETALTPLTAGYVLLQFLSFLGMIILLMVFNHTLVQQELIAACVFGLFSFYSLSQVQEGRSVALFTEVFRFALLCYGVISWQSSDVVNYLVGGFSLISLGVLVVTRCQADGAIHDTPKSDAKI